MVELMHCGSGWLSWELLMSVRHFSHYPASKRKSGREVRLPRGYVYMCAKRGGRWGQVLVSIFWEI